MKSRTAEQKPLLNKKVRLEIFSGKGEGSHPLGSAVLPDVSGLT
jgi:hypothetical protein